MVKKILHYTIDNPSRTLAILAGTGVAAYGVPKIYFAIKEGEKKKSRNTTNLLLSEILKAQPKAVKNNKPKPNRYDPIVY